MSLKFATTRILGILVLILQAEIASVAQSSQQSQNTLPVLSGLQEWSAGQPQEKVYLHIDQSFYLQGQTIWYKAYAITEPLGQLDTLSKNLYVELVNANSEILERQTVFLEAGLGNGHFELPDDIGSGLYYLRAYTNWMRNFDEEFFFLKPFEIENIQEGGKADRQTVKRSPVDLQFFPEGGDLLTGISSKLAFKAINKEGRAMKVNGKIYDAYGQELRPFQTGKLGMGWVYFTPETGDQYYAKLEGYPGEFNLPKAEAEGYTMGVNNGDDKRFSIVLNFRGETAEPGEPYIVIQADGSPYQVIRNIALDSYGQALLSIPKEGLPTGIAQVTLFNKRNLPELERLIFINNHDQLTAGVETTQKDYGLRKKVELSVKVRDAQGQPVKGSFSLAVVNEAFRSQNRFESSIASEFLLTSDLKGFIENPRQYFDEDNTHRNEDLDLLLLTQGWRRFKWKDLLKDGKSRFSHQMEKSISLSGRVYKLSKRSAPEKGATVSFVDLSSGNMVAANTETDGRGRFSFTDLVFDEKSPAMLKAQTKKGRANLRFVLDEKLIDTLILPKRSLAFLDDLAKDTADVSGGKVDPAGWNMGQFIDLGVFTVEKEQSKAKAKKMRVTSYGGRVLEVDKLLATQPSPLTLLDLLVGRVASLTVSRYGAAPHQIAVQSSRGRRGMLMSENGSELTGQEMLFVLDGQWVDQQLITSLTANSVESIEVLVGNAAAMYGLNGANGVISVTSKKEGSTWPGPRMIGTGSLKSKGYAYAREFYSPRYDVEDSSHENLDQRSLLHWVPNVLTNEAGEARISFFTGDIEGNYLIDLQGLGFNGKIAVSQKEIIRVKKE